MRLLVALCVCSVARAPPSVALEAATTSANALRSYRSDGAPKSDHRDHVVGVGAQRRFWGSARSESSACSEGGVLYADCLGFDPDDATDALQRALNASDLTVHQVVVRKMASPWTVRPVFFHRGNLRVVFEPGVIVQAKNDSFHGGDDALFMLKAPCPGPVCGPGHNGHAPGGFRNMTARVKNL